MLTIAFRVFPLWAKLGSWSRRWDLYSPQGGVEIRQCASNVPSVVEHLPANAKGALSGKEQALGLVWHCLYDHLGYKHHKTAECLPTMRHIHKGMASQYGHLGFVIPFTPRAKVLVQKLWANPRSWDHPNLPIDLLERRRAREQELPNLAKVVFPRCYIPSNFSEEVSRFSLHILYVYILCLMQINSPPGRLWLEGNIPVPSCVAALDAGARSPDYRSAESLPLGFKALKVGKPVPSSSQLSTLAPEFDEVLSLIRVGGQLRRLEGSSLIKIHPVVLDPVILLPSYSSKTLMDASRAGQSCCWTLSLLLDSER